MRTAGYLTLAAAMALVPAQIAIAQLVQTRTFAASGTYLGKHYISITVHYDTEQLTYNFDDGSIFTLASGRDPVLFWYIVRQLENGSPQGG